MVTLAVVDSGFVVAELDGCRMMLFMVEVCGLVLEVA